MSYSMIITLEFQLTKSKFKKYLVSKFIYDKSEFKAG